MQAPEVVFRCWSRQSTSVIGFRQGDSAKKCVLGDGEWIGCWWGVLLLARKSSDS